MIFPAFHPIRELQQNVADDRSSTPPFITDFLQVSKHSIATLYVIVRSDVGGGIVDRLALLVERRLGAVVVRLQRFPESLASGVPFAKFFSRVPLAHAFGLVNTTQCATSKGASLAQPHGFVYDRC